MQSTDTSEIRISLLTRNETSTRDFGEKLFRATQSKGRNLLAEKVGHTEPINFGVNSVEACLEKYLERSTFQLDGKILDKPKDIFWLKESKPSSSGSIFQRTINKFGDLCPGWITINSQPHACLEWHAFFRELIVITGAYYGTLHLFAPIELDSMRYQSDEVQNYGYNDHECGIAPIALERRGLSNLCWANYFGEGLDHLIDRPTIQSAGFAIEDVEGHPLLTITPDIFDIQKDIRGFFAARAKLKSLFKPGTFRIEEEPLIYPTDP